MATFSCPKCFSKHDAPDEYLGRVVRCLHCNTKARVTDANSSTPSLPAQPNQNTKTVSSPPKTAPPQKFPSKKTYKVLTQKDKWFTQKFDPAKLEEALNSYAEQGWVVKTASTASIPGLGGNRDELIVILER